MNSTYVSPPIRPEGCAQAGRSEGAGRVNLTLKTESSGMFSSTAWRPVSAGRGDEYRQTAAFSAVPAGPVAGRCDDSQCRGRSAKSGSPWLTLLPPSSHLRRDRDLWRFSRCPKRILFIIPCRDPRNSALRPARWRTGGDDAFKLEAHSTSHSEIVFHSPPTSPRLKRKQNPPPQRDTHSEGV